MMPPPPRGGHRTTLLVLGAGLLLFFPGLANHDLWNPNEPVFAEGAREMMLRGEWLVPYVNGALYVDKPILYFWAILAGSLPGGAVTPLAARLPSAVAGLLTLWVVVRFGRRAFGERAALLAGLALATMPVFVWEARFAQMDPMLTLFMFLCVVCFHRARQGRATTWLALSGAWAGLAVLTKGPVGVVLPGAAALAILAFERDLRFLLRPAWVAGAAAFALVGAPWYVAVHVAGHTDYLEEFFLRQNVTRFVNPFDHARPFYYYGIRFLTDLFPWSLFLPGVLWARPGGRGREARAWRLCAIYAAVTVLFFSASGAKRGVYILPMYPAYALLLGWFWDRVLHRFRARERERTFTVPMVLAGGVLVGAGALLLAARFAPVDGIRDYSEFFGPASFLGILFLSTGVAAWVALRPGAWPERAPARAFAALAIGLAAVYLTIALWIVPRVDVHKSARAFSQDVLHHAGPEAPLRSFRFWKWRSEYLFYTGRLMPILEATADVEEYLARPEAVFLIVEEADRADLERDLTAMHHLLLTRRVGGKTMHLYSNRPASPTGGTGLRLPAAR